MKTSLLFLVFLGGAFASPDCSVNFGAGGGVPLVGSGNAVQFSNRAKNCYDWRISYQAQGFSAISLIVEVAPDVSNSPGSWVSFTSPEASNPIQGVNPNVNIVSASSYFRGAPAWIRVRLASVTGSGSVSGILYGCQEPGCGSGMTAGGGVGPSPGTPTFIQAKTAFSTTGVSTQTVTFDAAPTVGNVVIVAVLTSTNQIGIDHVLDNHGNPQYIGLMRKFDSGSLGANLFCTPVYATGGTFTISSTSLGTLFQTVLAAEFSGTNCKLDNNAGVASATTPYDCGSYVTQNAKDLLLAVINNNNPLTVTFTAPTGFTQIAAVTNGAVAQPGALAYQVVSATSTYDPQYVTSTNVGSVCIGSALHASNT